MRRHKTTAMNAPHQSSIMDALHQSIIDGSSSPDRAPRPADFGG
jgi:hypothetical protein